MAFAIAIFALFVSLVALWLNSETMKKVSAGSDTIVKTHIKTLNNAIIESNKAVNTLTARVSALEKELQAAKAAQVKARETLAVIQQRTKSQQQSAATRQDQSTATG